MIKYPLIDDTVCSREDYVRDEMSDRKQVKTHKIGFPATLPSEIEIQKNDPLFEIPGICGCYGVYHFSTGLD